MINLSNIKDIIQNKATKLSIEDVLSKICVSPPYFAFKEIYKYQDYLIAPIVPEQKNKFEKTIITSAEASRHMAILGSCVISIDNIERAYYLAVEADMRSGDNTDQICSIKKQNLYTISKKLSGSNKKAESLNFLCTNEGLVLFQFKVGYQILPKQVFKKLFKKYYNKTDIIKESPYKNIPTFTNIVINNNVAEAVLPPIKKEKCAGHFTNYPILPVGVLAYMSIDVIRVFLNKINKEQQCQYVVDQAYMKVLHPTDINDQYKLIIKYLDRINNLYSFRWKLFDDSKIINTMDISFKLV